MAITKEDYKRYRQCAKVAWLLQAKHLPLTKSWAETQLTYCFSLPNLNPESKVAWDELALANTTVYDAPTIQDGKEVGDAAKKYFSANKCCDLTALHGLAAQQATQTALSNPKIETIFEGYFTVQGCVARPDVLVREQTGWQLIEVKATTKIKPEHFHDILYQYVILTQAGLKITSLKIMHLNRSYIRHGALDISQLFMFSNSLMRDRVETDLYTAIQTELANRDFFADISQLKTLLMQTEPQVLPWLQGADCDNLTNNPKKPYCTHVFKHLPDTDTIFNLYRLTKVRRAELYYESGLLALTDPRLRAEALTPLQQRQIAVVTAQEAWLVDLASLLVTLADYNYPICMYDFETMQAAIPKFDGSWPYQQIPFQYSIHILVDPKFSWEPPQKLVHREFLASTATDPRLALAQQLLLDLKPYATGSFVAYNSSFEKMILGELERFAPVAPWYEALAILKDKTIDLMDFFKKFAIYHPAFNGSLSLKKTLPAFAPEFGYQDLIIQKGDAAAEYFRRFVEQSILEPEWQTKVRPALLKYCGRDTLAMVVLFRHILTLITQAMPSLSGDH